MTAQRRPAPPSPRAQPTSLLPEPFLEHVPSSLSPPSGSQAHPFICPAGLPTSLLPLWTLFSSWKDPPRSPGTHRLRPLPAGHALWAPRCILPGLPHCPAARVTREGPHATRPPAHISASTPGLPGHGGVSSRSVLCQDRLEGKLWPWLLPSETDDSRPGTQSPRSNCGLGPLSSPGHRQRGPGRSQASATHSCVALDKPFLRLSPVFSAVESGP